MGLLQNVVAAIFPDRCLACGGLVDGEGGLCGPCWRDMPFVVGAVCATCGAPLPGEAAGDERCDDCLALARPWDAGRTATTYEGAARQLVLRLKHADRLDLARPAAGWMLRAARPLLTAGTVLVPVPSHWRRRVARRFSQAAVLAHAMGRAGGLAVEARALIRTRATPVQDGMGVEARFRNVGDAIRPHPRLGARLAGRDVILVDDVMTSGATLAAATEAARAAGAGRIGVATLARVVRTP